MPVKNATPYLFFNGTAQAAIHLYERALEARTEALMHYEGSPDTGMRLEPGDADRVMHAVLHVGDARLMISDAPTTTPAATESNVDVCLEFDDPEELGRKFRSLAEGGRVVQDVHDAFWGAKFGMLVDVYGIHWMFNCSTPRPEQAGP
jgi:PhnB protein